MLNKLKTSLMNCSFCSLKKVQVLVTRRSSELKSRPNLRFGSTCDSLNLPGLTPGLGGGPSALQGDGDGTAAVHVGNAFQTSIAALSWAPVEISRPSALRGRIGSRALRAGTSESMGTRELIVQMGEIVIFQGTSKTP